MKFKSLFFAAVTAAFAFISCENESENLGAPDLSISTSSMEFEAAGGDQELTVTATRDWKVTSDAEWVVVSPEAGEASSKAQTVTVSVLENTGMDREASLKFTI